MVPIESVPWAAQSDPMTQAQPSTSRSKKSSRGRDVFRFSDDENNNSNDEVSTVTTGPILPGIQGLPHVDDTSHSEEDEDDFIDSPAPKKTRK